MLCSPRIPVLLALSVAATGCAVVEDPFAAEFPAAGVHRLVASIEEGDLTLQGDPWTDDIALSGRTYGAAGSQERAGELEDAAGYRLEQRGGDLVLDAWSGGGLSSGVDVWIASPTTLASDIVLEAGTANLGGLVGVHTVRAGRIIGSDLGGQLELVASSSGLDLDLSPASGDRYLLHAIDGDVDLVLPFGLEYDLQVWGDPESELIVEDLGFDAMATDVAYFAGVRGRGTVRIDVVAEGGDVRIHGSRW